MRYAFYALIVVNVVFLLWATGIGRNAGTMDRALHELALPEGVEKIVLAKERAGSHGAVTARATTELGAHPLPVVVPDPSIQPDDEPAAPDVTCFDIGPFTATEEADQLAELLRPRTNKAEVSLRPTGMPEGWWVIFPKANSIEAARENRRMLTDKGVRDAWIFEHGDLAGAISLGLFKTKEEADAAQKQFNQQSVVTEVVPRLIRSQAYWVRVPWFRTPLELEEALQSIASGLEGKQFPRPIPCD